MGYGAGHDDCALGPNRRYNKRTEKVLSDAAKGKGIKRFTSLEALFADLRD